ncbi:MAG: hypothetical protein IPM47_16305 [Sphingobacteriales bacterium]|nr:MAG: hypothetical protein IPM47_16305 [Sphingobacteriales bacterium]
MKRFFSVLLLAVALLAFNHVSAQTYSDVDQNHKSSCAAKKAAASAENNTDESSTKMVETAGVSEDAAKTGTSCASKASASGKKCDPAACAAKKAAASAENNTDESSTKMVESAGVSEGDASKVGTTCASKTAASGKKCDPAACAGKKASANVENNTEEGSTKMIESPGVSSEKKSGCCANKATGCKNKKAEN